MKKLAIAQIVLGILIVGSLIFWAGWVSTGYYESVGTTPDGNIIHELGLQKPNPLMDAWTIVYLLLGLSVLSCGIAQFVKAKRRITGKAAELDSGDESSEVKV